jgi:hypothetical protein
VAKSLKVPRQPSANEATADRIVAEIRSLDLGVELVPDFVDTGAEQKMHDFWLIGDGAREALEVTTLMDQTALTNLRHWERIGPEPDVVIPGLAKAWMLMVDPQFNARSSPTN